MLPSKNTEKKQNVSSIMTHDIKFVCRLIATIISTMIIIFGFILVFYNNPMFSLLSIKLDEGICFILSGLTIILAQKTNFNQPTKLITILPAIVLIIISGLSFFMYLSSTNLNSGNIFTSNIRSYYENILIMSIFLFIVGPTLLLLISNRFNPWIFQSLAWGIYSFSIFSFCSKVNHVETSVYLIPKLTTIPLSTAALFMLLSIGIILSRPNEGILKILLRKNIGGYILRLILTVTLLMPIAISYLENKGSEQGLWEERFGDSINAISSFIILSIVIVIIARVLERERLKHKEAQKKIKEQELILTKFTKDTEEKFINIIQRDQLTSLLNRLSFQEKLTSLIISKKFKYIAVFFIDITKFRFLNESLGHKKGDILLKAVALRLNEFFNNGLDNIARVNADKFAIYEKFKLSEEIQHYSNKIELVFKEPFIIEQTVNKLSIKIGAAINPENNTDGLTLLQNAEFALSYAKTQKSKIIKFYSEDMFNKASEKIIIENDLQHALTNNEFIVYFQPQVNLKTNKICGAEALIRWQHPTKGLLLPVNFIQLANETDLIDSINDHMLRAVFAIVNSDWSGPPVSVNISAQAFMNKYHFLEYIEELTEKYHVLPKNIEFEITESLLMENVQHNIAILFALKKLGFSFSIDDFGTGYSSFNYLSRIPADKIKIDMSFIKGLPLNRENAMIVKSIIALFHSLNMKVIAEGAATEEEIQFLKHENCDTVQGYYYYKPMPYEEFITLISSTVLY